MTRKYRPSKEQLQKEYGELRSTIKLGNIHGVSNGTIWRWMKEYSIKINNVGGYSFKKPPKEELEEKCKELNYNSRKVGEYYNVSPSTAGRWMEKEGIEKGKSFEQDHKPSLEELQKKFKELGNNARKVGEYYGISRQTPLNWMKEYGIERAKSSHQISLERKPSKEQLKKKYNKLGSFRKVGEYYGISRQTAKKWIIDYGLKLLSSIGGSPKPFGFYSKNPKNVDRVFDKLKEEIGRIPKSDEFKKNYRGAFNAIIRRRYNPNIYTYHQYLNHRSLPARIRQNSLKQALDNMLNDYTQGGGK